MNKDEVMIIDGSIIKLKSLPSMLFEISKVWVAVTETPDLNELEEYIKEVRDSINNNGDIPTLSNINVCYNMMIKMFEYGEEIDELVVVDIHNETIDITFSKETLKIDSKNFVRSPEPPTPLGGNRLCYSVNISPQELKDKIESNEIYNIMGEMMVYDKNIIGENNTEKLKEIDGFYNSLTENIKNKIISK